MKLELLTCRTPQVVPSERPPLLFIHGAFCGAWVWAEHFMPFFARRGYDCLAISLRGHGASGGKAALPDAGLIDYTADAACALFRLRQPPVVIGHSLGGSVAQRLAEHHGVAGLVLLASVPPSGLMQSALHMMQQAPDLLCQIALLQTLGPSAVDPGAIHRALFAPDTPPEVVLPYLPRLQSESRRVSLDLMGWRWPLRSSPCPPTLVIGGDIDRFLPVSAFKETACYYGGDLNILPGVPHGLMLDPRWPQVAEAILDWLERRFL